MILIFGVINQYGVLSHFSEGIKSDLESLGEECLVLPVDDGMQAAQLLRQVTKDQVKFSICINGAGLDTALTFGKSYAFAVDHPLLILPHLQKFKGFELLCVAKEHTAFANLINIPARDFPHAVSKADIVPLQTIRRQHSGAILFPASYNDKASAQKKLQELGVWEQVKPALKAVGSINEFLMAIGVLPNGNQPAKTPLNETIYKITCEADLYIRALARERVLETYANKGIELDVYGRNVANYKEEHPTHRYHGEIPYSQLLKKFAEAKYVVHNSPGFQFALHERIVFPLAKGTPVLFNANTNQQQMLTNLPSVYQSENVSLPPSPDDLAISLKEIETKHTWASRLQPLLD